MHEDVMKYSREFLENIFAIPATEVAITFGFKPFLRSGHVEEFAKFIDENQLLMVSTERSFSSAPHAPIWKVSRRDRRGSVVREVDRLTTFYEAILLSGLIPPVETLSTQKIGYGDLLDSKGALPAPGDRFELAFKVVRTAFIADAGLKGTVKASGASLIRLELDAALGDTGNGPTIIEWYPLTVPGDWFNFWRDTRALG